MVFHSATSAGAVGSWKIAPPLDALLPAIVLPEMMLEPLL